MKTTSWQLFGLFVEHSGTALVHCPTYGHRLQDDLGLALLGEQRWPVQGSALKCSSCKSTGAVSYSGLIETPTLPALWQEIIAGLELPSTRMLLSQQAELLAVDNSTGTVVVGIKGEWLPMAQSRLPLLEKAVAAVLPGHKPVLRPTALQSAAAPQLQEAAAIPAAENEKVGPERPEFWVPNPRFCLAPEIEEPIAPVVITQIEVPAPAAPPSPAPVAVESNTTIPVFERGQEPRGRVISGMLHLSLSDWRKLLPALDN